MIIKSYEGTGWLTSGTKVRSKVQYLIEVRGPTERKHIEAYITAPPHLLYAAWKLGRSTLELETGEILEVTVLSRSAQDRAPIAIGLMSARRLEASF